MRSSRSVAQAPRRASKHWVVVAFVYSELRDSAEPEVEDVRHEEEGVRRLERRVVVSGHAPELEHRVDRHQLDSRPLVQLAGRHPLEDAPPRPGAAGVAVVHRVLQEPAVAVDQAEVDAPRVDRDANRRRRTLARAARRPSSDVVEEPQDVPMERPAGAHGHVREPVDLASTDTRSPSKRPTATRPLCAPRSTAASVAISRCLVVRDRPPEVARAQRRRLARPGVDGDHVDPGSAPVIRPLRRARSSR